MDASCGRVRHAFCEMIRKNVHEAEQYGRASYLALVATIAIHNAQNLLFHHCV